MIWLHDIFILVLVFNIKSIPSWQNTGSVQWICGMEMDAGRNTHIVTHTSSHPSNILSQTNMIHIISVGFPKSTEFLLTWDELESTT